MTHPHQDPELLAIVGAQPHADAIWCEECCRWEAGYKVHDRPPVGPGVQEQLDKATRALKRAAKYTRAAELLQARFLVEQGLGFSQGRPR